MPDRQDGLRLLSSSDLTPADKTALRKLFDVAFGGRFDDSDWHHALGGIHVLLQIDGAPAAHAAIVERELHVDGTPLRTGYVEAVATRPDLQGTGLGTQVMRAAGAYLLEHFELGALSTG